MFVNWLSDCWLTSINVENLLNCCFGKQRGVYNNGIYNC